MAGAIGINRLVFGLCLINLPLNFTGLCPSAIHALEEAKEGLFYPYQGPFDPHAANPFKTS